MDLQEYIEREIVPRYNNFDKGHGPHHVRAVMNRSLYYAGRFGADPRMAYVIAAYHDLGLCEGREQHHITSGRILAADEQLRRWFGEEQLVVMREAVEDHRASAGREPRSLYGKIVAEADRLIEPDTVTRRCLQYGLKNMPAGTTREQHYERTRHHLREKYGAGGYLQLWLPGTENARRLEALRSLIADETALRTTFDHIYDEECPAT